MKLNPLFLSTIYSSTIFSVLLSVNSINSAYVYAQGIKVQSINAQDKNQSVLSFLLTMPCEGWQTSLIHLSGYPQTKESNAVQTNTYNLLEDDLLKEYGCQSRAKRILHRGQRQIIIEAYQFATVDGAAGAYYAARQGSSSYLTQGAASSEDQDSISFYLDRYFIHLYSTESNDDEAKAVISQLASRIINNIQTTISGLGNTNNSLPGDRKPNIFSAMPALTRVKGSEKLVMGPMGLKKFFPAPYSNILAPLLEGTIADYIFDEPERDRMKLLIAYYPSSKDAGLIYANYVNTLRSQHKEKSVNDLSFPTTLFKLANGFMLCQLRDKQLVIITGARHKESTVDLARQIYSL